MVAIAQTSGICTCSTYDHSDSTATTMTVTSGCCNRCGRPYRKQSNKQVVAIVIDEVRKDSFDYEFMIKQLYKEKMKSLKSGWYFMKHIKPTKKIESRSDKNHKIRSRLQIRRRYRWRF